MPRADRADNSVCVVQWFSNPSPSVEKLGQQSQAVLAGRTALEIGDNLSWSLQAASAAL